MKIINRLKNKLINFGFSKPADLVIGDRFNPYLMRWHFIPRNQFLNIYLHLIINDDDGRALHDHPWFSVSWLMFGSLLEHTQGKCLLRKEGSLVFRSPWCKHRLSLLPRKEVWTLFITGPKIKDWGFLCDDGRFYPHDVYLEHQEPI